MQQETGCVKDLIQVAGQWIELEISIEETCLEKKKTSLSPSS